MTKPQPTTGASGQMSLREKTEMMIRLASYPALSLMLFLRRDIVPDASVGVAINTPRLNPG